MSDAPSLIASALAVAGSVAVAAIQRGAGAAAAAAKEMVAELETKLRALEAKVTDLDRRLSQWEATLSAGVNEAKNATRGFTDLRTYVHTQLEAARRDWHAFRRDMGRVSGTNEGATAEELGTMARELATMGRRLDDFRRDVDGLNKRMDKVDEEMKEDRRAETDKQRELGGLLATLQIVLEDRKGQKR